MAIAVIRLDHVTKSYDRERTFAVRDLSMTIPGGTSLTLVGESGCGKTTTLKMINRLIEPDAGCIRLDGEDIMSIAPVALRRRIGYVFQGIGLFPHYTVARNVGIVPRLLGWRENDVRARIDETLALVGLAPAEYAHRLPAELSGGQRQRVGVARALAARPEVMLMDEPFGALDPITRRQIQREFQEIRGQLGLTSVLVTHDMTEALLLGDLVAVMREGTLLQLATPHELLTAPADDYVAELVAMERGRADDVEALVQDGGTPEQP